MVPRLELRLTGRSAKDARAVVDTGPGRSCRPHRWCGRGLRRRGGGQQGATFENQRTAELQDLLIDAYARYLRDATATWFAATLEDPRFEEARTKKLAAEALASETEVEFEAVSAVDDAAKRRYHAVTKPRLLTTFKDRRPDFIDAAGRSLDG
jgi:hypothetical protein